MDIIELLNVKTKKDLLELLKKHSIKYKKRFGEISFKANINTYDFTIYTYIQGKSVNTFRIVMDNKKYDYDMMVQNMLALKDNFVSLFGKPKMDNTNHLNKNNISINFVTESLSLSITCNNFNEYGSMPYAAIFVSDTNQKLNKVHNQRSFSILGLWIPSFIGGFVWGLVMYLSMGAKYGYNINNFIIWMCGGLFFGVAFGVLFSIFGGVNNDIIKKGKVKKEQVIKQFSLENKNDLFNGRIFTYNSSSPHSLKQRMDLAILEITDVNVIVYSIIKKKETILKTPIKSAYFQLLTRRNLNFNRGNDIYLFSFDDITKYNELDNKLFDKLINKEKYNILFKRLKEVTLEYNPYQIYESNDNTCLDDKISDVTKALLLKEHIKQADFQEIIYVIFDYDRYYAESLVDLYFDVYDKVANEK